MPSVVWGGAAINGDCSSKGEDDSSACADDVFDAVSVATSVLGLLRTLSLLCFFPLASVWLFAFSVCPVEPSCSEAAGEKLWQGEEGVCALASKRPELSVAFPNTFPKPELSPKVELALLEL